MAKPIVVLGRGLDLVLGPVDVHLVLDGIDPPNHTGRQQHLRPKVHGPVSTTRYDDPSSPSVASSTWPMSPSTAATE